MYQNIQGYSKIGAAPSITHSLEEYHRSLEYRWAACQGNGSPSILLHIVERAHIPFGIYSLVVHIVPFQEIHNLCLMFFTFFPLSSTPLVPKASGRWYFLKSSSFVQCTVIYVLLYSITGCMKAESRELINTC